MSAGSPLRLLLGLALAWGLTGCPGPASDFCPFDPDKTAPGLCGCGVPDDDADADGIPDCQDICDGFDDRDNHDGDPYPDGCDADLFPCDSDADCDDGLDCTTNYCDGDDLCRTEPDGVCPWPAEGPTDALNLTPLEDGFESNLSAAAWNPITEILWVGSNDGPARVWAVDLSDRDDPEIPEDSDGRAQWGSGADFGDLEALTIVDYTADSVIHTLSEVDNTITEWDLHKLDDADDDQVYDLSGLVPDPEGLDGAEGLTFVPNEFLAAQRFEDADADRVVGVGGLGGLMFVGHQARGHIYVLDLDPEDGSAVLVGEYETALDSTAGLEFDRSTGLLYIWHGGAEQVLEVARLSSTSAGDERRLDTVMLYEGPGAPAGGSTNLEGFAIGEGGACTGSRDAFLTTDGGFAWSLLAYGEFPCGR